MHRQAGDLELSGGKWRDILAPVIVAHWFISAGSGKALIGHEQVMSFILPLLAAEPIVNDSGGGSARRKGIRDFLRLLGNAHIIVANLRPDINAPG